MTNTQLCKGFITTRFDEQSFKGFETQYALLETGKVFVTEEREISIHFETKNWIASSLDKDQLKAINAEFIGNYKVSI
jgi:hypothetical protein